MKTISLSVTEFALPCPLQGSIDSLSGFGRNAAATGLEIHQRIQQERTKEHPHYRAEVLASQDFEQENYLFRVGGRMDGFYDSENPTIEEIKSTFHIHELRKRLRQEPDSHPYQLQLRTYGYLHWLRTGKVPRLVFLLVSTRTQETSELEIDLDLESYKAWLGRRLQELAEQARQSEKRVKRRKKAAQNLNFPFANPRSGQIELIQTIEQGMSEKRPLMIQAPTGLGKTVGVLYPTLREALTRGQKVIYVTPKNSQHSVAEEAIDRLVDAGASLKAMTLTAKSKICMKAEPLCQPDYCEYAKDHYTKMGEHGLLEKLAQKRRLTARTFRQMADEYQVCPFEIQLDAARNVDTVICDYNYVFAPRSSFGRLAQTDFAQEGKPNLVIDEAHNLPSRAMDSYSPSLSSYVLEKMREPLQLLPERFRIEALGLLDDCLSTLKSCAPKSMEQPAPIDPPVKPFLVQDENLRGFLSRYLKSDVVIQAQDPVLKLSFYWSEFTAALEFVVAGRHEFFTTFYPNPATIKITCCDASEMLKACYDEYQQVIAFSATLKPFDYYSQLSGLRTASLKTAEFLSPFPKEHRKLLLIPQISSKYAQRQRSAPRIALTVAKIAELKRGNYFIFFPSFEFMEQTLRQFTPPPGFRVLKQERTMKRAAIDDVLEQLRQPELAHIIFAVQGGIFSEGVDYPGDMVIGAFIVGPPLPSFDLERERMREYYEQNYAAGFDYAYAFPAMAKAVQAAGRVIRSEDDRGLIVLMDERFMHSSYSQSMPQDWYEESPSELVSDRILKEVADFWHPPTIELD